MHETTGPDRAKMQMRNSRVVFACLAVVVGMGGLAYASVPLYQLFCQVTGYGGTTQRATNSQGIEILDREATVRFDANTAPDLDWDFKPVQRSVKVKLGEMTQISYTIENNTDRVLQGSATFNVTPQSVGAYFNKIECFCFTETMVEPGEKLEMPVVFYLDPEMVESEEVADIQTVTLSYTFFASEPDQDTLSSNTIEKSAGSAGG
ncbi:MAG: cytochrome c oxidase assembly protein [Rhizobiaceae bacterium]